MFCFSLSRSGACKWVQFLWKHRTLVEARAYERVGSFFVYICRPLSLCLLLSFARSLLHSHHNSATAAVAASFQCTGSPRAGINHPPPKCTWWVYFVGVFGFGFVVDAGRNHRLKKRRHWAVARSDFPWISAGDRNELRKKLRVAGPTCDACRGNVAPTVYLWCYLL